MAITSNWHENIEHTYKYKIEHIRYGKNNEQETDLEGRECDSTFVPAISCSTFCFSVPLMPIVLYFVGILYANAYTFRRTEFAKANSLPSV